MEDTEHEVETYVSHLDFPLTREELINGLLVRDAPGRMIALVERLAESRYNTREDLRRDLTELSQVHAREVEPARSYDDFLAVVRRHVGDVTYATKEEYNRVVENVVHIAQQQGTLDRTGADQMQQQLEGAFAHLRGAMSEVYDYQAPIDPHADLPRSNEEESG